ncbi:2-hydroxyacyl-CoA lyase 2 [Frankliniella fusca]|uniref:2-hydroxyacyl-CoA lyase 2 n=1 Tax=Frankliniella fusca TaxID=407009 RepID=A0AAE1LKW3_9NEOP|nr:2-hydroxyacyl-CoA lyase 2 [Frankliniella fusca]
MLRPGHPSPESWPQQPGRADGCRSVCVCCASRCFFVCFPLCFACVSVRVVRDAIMPVVRRPGDT